tara:strand:+ start:360 stop:686 length:327 start_codon:yes stop_codon:yes gene_type:complete
MPPKPKKKVVQDSIKPTYKNIGLANFASGQTTATKRDSIQYARGFDYGLKQKENLTVKQAGQKYLNTSQYFNKGRWEGKNNPSSALNNTSKGSDTTFVQRVQSFFNFN